MAVRRAVLVPVIGTGLHMYCVNRAVVVPVLGTGLHMHCVRRAVLVPVIGLWTSCRAAPARVRRPTINCKALVLASYFIVCQMAQLGLFCKTE